MTLREHAQRELEIVGEEPKVIEWYLGVIDKFNEFGHSGHSAEHTTRVLEQLLRYKNLTPLTDDPDEWTDVAKYGDGSAMWQNKRNPEAFSIDNGKTYKLISQHNPGVYHATERKTK
jgi:hypothetical protein